MAKRLSIPLGAMPDDQIKQGVRAVTEKLCGTLKKSIGSRCRITAEHVNTQHEVLRDNVTVGLKYIEYQINLRQEVTVGARIKIFWNWNKKEEVSLSISSASELEKRMVYGAMVAALLVAGILILGSNATSSGRTMAGAAFFVLFMILFLVFLIPFPFVRVYLGVRNHALIEEVAGIATAVFLSGKPPG